MIIDSLQQLQIDAPDVQWSSDLDHWVVLREHGRLTDMTSIPFRVTEMVNRGEIMTNLGHVNEVAYDMIKSVMLSKGAVGFIDIDTQQLTYYRLVLDVGVDDILKCPDEFDLKIKCLDEHDNCHEVQSLSVIKSKIFKSKLKFNVSDRGDFHRVSLDTPGVYDFKITCLFKDHKLKCYLRCQR